MKNSFALVLSFNHSRMRNPKNGSVQLASSRHTLDPLSFRSQVSDAAASGWVLWM
jgi:hypothetical protein